jgi:hypothetical protein
MTDYYPPEETRSWSPEFTAAMEGYYDALIEPAEWEEVEPIMALLPEYAMYRALSPAPPEWTLPGGVTWARGA